MPILATRWRRFWFGNYRTRLISNIFTSRLSRSIVNYYLMEFIIIDYYKIKVFFFGGGRGIFRVVWTFWVIRGRRVWNANATPQLRCSVSCNAAESRGVRNASFDRVQQSVQRCCTDWPLGPPPFLFICQLALLCAPAPQSLLLASKRPIDYFVSLLFINWLICQCWLSNFFFLAFIYTWCYKRTPDYGL